MKEFFTRPSDSPCAFIPIATTKTAQDFLNDREPPTPPDND